MRAGHTCRVCIHGLMTSGASQSRNSDAEWTSNDVGKVTMPVIALLRITPRCVAVDTARMSQHGIDLLPGGKSMVSGSSCTRLARARSWHRRDRDEDDGEKPYSCQRDTPSPLSCNS